ncbi:MAG: hypothetical protein H6582_01130 [Crocinitomicaceae bacterium]|nr:hypothetical protein [Crocinitomicaceae bacterium]
MLALAKRYELLERNNIKLNKLLIYSFIVFAVYSCRKDPLLNNNKSTDWQLRTFTSGGAVKDGHMVQFFGNETVFVGGYSNSLYPSGVSWYSSDNGITWNTAFGNFEGQPINTISLINDSSAFIISSSIGDPDLIYTNDYCLNFSNNSLGTSCAPNINTTAIHFFNDSLGFVDDKRTENGGQSWICSTLPTSNYYFFLNDSLGYSCSGNELLLTLDTGWTWSNVYTSSNLLKEVRFFDESNGLLLAGTELLKSIDGGTTWTTLKSEVNSFYFIDSQTGLITSDNKILKTTDSGITWSQVFETDKISFLDIAWRGNTAIAVGIQLNATENGDYFIAISNNP